MINFSCFPSGEKYAYYINVLWDNNTNVFFAPGEHCPPHFHAYYNEYKASFSLESLEIIDGELPRKQTTLVLAWSELHIDELKADWNLAMNGEPVFKIDPLS